MSGSPGFAELEKARKPQKGKRGHGAATFRFHLGVRRAAAGAQTPVTPTPPLLLEGPHRPRAGLGHEAVRPEP